MLNGTILHEGGAFVTPANASFVTGDMLNGFTVLEAADVSFGMRLLAPLNQRAYIASVKSATFTGRAFDVYTERCAKGDPLKKRSADQLGGRPEFHAVCFSGSLLARVIPGDPFTYDLAPIDKIKKGDVVVSMPVTAPQAAACAFPLRVNGALVRAMFTRVSFVTAKVVKKMPAVAMEIDSPSGLIVDGVAVGGGHQVDEETKEAVAHVV